MAARPPTVIPGPSPLRWLLATGLLSLAGLAAPPVFDGDPTSPVESPEGKAVLSWSWPEAAAGAAATFEVQQSTDPAFAPARVIYEGPDQATVVTGLPEGAYYYRVRVVAGSVPSTDWSAVATVNVVYPGRRTVGWLMALGSVVFLATVTAVGAGHRSAAKGGTGS